MAATTTSGALRWRSRGGGLVLVTALALGCGGKSQTSSDAAAPDRPFDVVGPGPLPATCGGTLSVIGYGPDGDFAATSVYAEVSTTTCQRGVRFVVADSTTGASFSFLWPVDPVDAGTPGATIPVAVDFVGRPNTEAGRFQITTPGTLNVPVADPPPFATCELADGDPIALGTGNVMMAVELGQDGFNIAGVLSTPYCSCRACPDTI